MLGAASRRTSRARSRPASATSGARTRCCAKVQENIDFLEKPEEIEAKGGYVPSGILLWGPPGTGKTLMAEAVAGETGKPYVFVDPVGVHADVHRRRRR